MIHLTLFELEPDLKSDFSHWYETEHVPDVLSRPGWRQILHYRCLSEPLFLSLYTLEDDLPLRPNISAAPFHSGPFSARGIRNYYARTWREIHAAGTASAPASWINAVIVEIEQLALETFNRWYNEVHVPEILACPGWRANRRFQCLDGEPSVLAIYELDDPDLAFTSPEWNAVVGWDEHAKHIRGFHGFRVYELAFERAAAH